MTPITVIIRDIIVDVVVTYGTHDEMWSIDWLLNWWRIKGILE